VADCATLGQTHPPGATYSYCNSGYVILGHLVAVLRGQTWGEALREHVFAPADMQRSGTLPEDVIWRRLAAGHQRGDDGRPELLAAWEAERSHGPAGGVVTSARQLLEFAAAFGSGKLVSTESVQAMTAPHVVLPNPADGETHQGLGWAVTQRAGQPMLFGHDGDLLGHHSLLVVCPERGFAAAVLTNGDGRDRIERRILQPLLGEIGVHRPDPPQPAEPPPHLDLRALSGVYETPALRITVRPADQHLGATLRVIDERIAALLPESQRERRIELLPVTPELFVTRESPEEPWTPAVFASSDGETYLHMGARAVRRVGEPA
jgi:CubicO group peptidase (beta-lactamase class C family)